MAFAHWQSQCHPETQTKAIVNSGHSGVEAPVSQVAPALLMTMEQMLTLPDDKRVERKMIRGELRERSRVIPTRHYGSMMARLGRFLGDVVDESSETRGEVASRAGFRLHRDFAPPAT